MSPESNASVLRALNGVIASVDTVGVKVDGIAERITRTEERVATLASDVGQIDRILRGDNGAASLVTRVASLTSRVDTLTTAITRMDTHAQQGMSHRAMIMTACISALSAMACAALAAFT